jgi:hypothetical protein
MKIFFVLYTLEVYNKVLNIFICNLLLTPSFTEQIKVLLQVASGCYQSKLLYAFRIFWNSLGNRLVMDRYNLSVIYVSFQHQMSVL